MNINNVSFRGILASKPVQDTVDKAKTKATSFGSGLEKAITHNFESTSRGKKIDKAIEKASDVLQFTAKVLGIDPADMLARKVKRSNHSQKGTHA
jgi:hypothetical protein